MSLACEAHVTLSHGGFDELHKPASLDLGHVVARNFFDRNEANWNKNLLQPLYAMTAQFALVERTALDDQSMNFLDA
jgi:hypothetical protein